MPEIKLTAEELRYISLFQDFTGATVRDCIVDENSDTLIFIVNKGQAGLAIGRRGTNIKQLRKLIGKNIEVVEWAENFEDFVKNIFMPARVLGVKLVNTPSGKRTVFVTVDPRDKAIAIGKGGRNVNKARLILKRYYDINSVVIV